MATTAAALNMFDGQAATLSAMDTAVQKVSDGFERISIAIDGATQKIGELFDELYESPQAAQTAGENMKAPFESMVKGVASTALNPETFKRLMESPQNIVLSLAIGVVWEVLGDDILALLTPVLDTVTFAASGVSTAIGFIRDNLAFLDPIVWGIVAAMGAYYAITVAVNTILKLIALAEAAGAAVKAITTNLTFSQATAQWGLNAALLACPLTWIVLAIIAVIVAIIAWINHVGGLKVAWLMAVNVILTIWDLLKIGFFTGVNWVLDLLNKMKLGFAVVSVGIANFIGDMRTNVLMILQNLVNGAIGIINNLIGVLNKLPGVDIGLIGEISFGTDAQLANEAEKQARNTGLAAFYDEIMAGKANREADLQAMKDDARNAAAQRQREIDAARIEAANKAEDNPASNDPSNPLQKTIEQDTKPYEPGQNPYDQAMALDGVYSNTGDTAANTAAVAESLSIAEEDLNSLRDIAEREAINRFTTAEVHIDMSGMTNRLDNSMDVDGIITRFVDGVTEELSVMAEGVHA